MFIRRILVPFLYCETPDPGSGGAGGTAVAPGAVQSEPGQGAPAENGSQNFWGLFPNVPEEHRSMLEPHLRAIQGEVGRLQEAHAPFKDYNPQEVQGLVQFDARFRSDPVGTWMDMAKMMQEQGALHEDLDLDTLAAVARGEDIPDEEDGTVEPGIEGLDPAVARHIQEMQARLDAFEERDQQRTVQQQTAVQDRLLETQKGKMKETLVKAGYPEELLTDQRIIASIIAHRGQISAATQSMMEERNAILKGFTQQKSTSDEELEVRNGGPQSPAQPRVSVRERDDPFAQAREKATSRLRRANRAEAQS